jgi:hypothetical protein
MESRAKPNSLQLGIIVITIEYDTSIQTSLSASKIEHDNVVTVRRDHAFNILYDIHALARRTTRSGPFSITNLSTS